MEDELKLEAYKRMTKSRIFEENMKECFQEGEIPGFIHLSIGEEAVATGACLALDNKDTVLGTHRGHGISIAKGADINKLTSEIFGRKAGSCGGRGGSMHVADVEKGVKGCYGVVGETIPLACGMALTYITNSTGQVSLAFFGDGAVNTGAFHEGLNLASIWDLPSVFVCVNNQYAVSTKINKVINIDKVSARADSYGIPGETVDGNNVIEVFETVKKAVERARKEKIPTLIEAVTFRIEGHYVGDPQSTREEREIEKWREKDPILRLKNHLLESEIATEDEISSMRKNAEAEIKDAMEYARECSYPDEGTLKDLW